MPVPKNDAAPQPEAGTETINVLTPEEMQDYIAELEAKMIRMEGLIADVTQRTRKIENIEPPSVPTAPTVREGYKRYWSKFSEDSVFRSGAWKEVINGTPVTHGAICADFSGHVYETNDKQIQEWLDNHPDNGITFYEDPTAVKQHNRVGIIEGARGTETLVHNPLEAQIP